MPPKAQSAERLGHEIAAQRARAAALQYLAKTGSGPSQRELAQQQRDRERVTNATTAAIQARLAAQAAAHSAADGSMGPTRDNTLQAIAANRARQMHQRSGGMNTADGAAGMQGRSPYESSTGAAATESSSSSSLPAGWKAAVDPTSGETYYWNEVTKETSWTRPDDATKSPNDEDDEEAAAADAKEDGAPLEPGWEAVQDPETGATYYWHADTNATTWTRPVRVSLEQAREAKSKLDAILKLCGPSSTTKKKNVVASEPKDNGEAKKRQRVENDERPRTSQPTDKRTRTT